MENLRARLEGIEQTDFEDDVTYLSRFREMADVARPPPRNDVLQSQLVRNLLTGMKDKELAYNISLYRQPADLDSTELIIREAATLKKNLQPNNGALTALQYEGDVIPPLKTEMMVF